MDRIQGIVGLKSSTDNPLLTKIKSNADKTGVNFSERLKGALEDINYRQNHADSKLEMLANGQDVDLHGTLLAYKEAEVSLKLAGTFRDKLTEAYKTLINMQI